MRGGHNRLTTSVKEAQGTLRPSRENPAEPRLMAKKLPGPPKGIPDDERAVWRRLKKQIDALYICTESDVELFRILVAAVTEFERVKVDPGAGINRKLNVWKAATSLLEKFGLTPQSRARVYQLDKPEGEKSALAEFFEDDPSDEEQTLDS